MLEDKLKKVIDIERLQRKLSLKLLQPCDFCNMDTSYNNILKIFEMDIFEENLKFLLPKSEDIKLFKKFIKEYQVDCDFNESGKYYASSKFEDKKILENFSKTLSNLDFENELLFNKDLKKRLGTDFYNERMEKVKTVPYRHNYGYLFTSGPNTWHGMEKKKIVKERRCIQVNYVTFKTDWKVK